MADYYSQCSELVHCTLEQYEWLVDYLEENDELYVLGCIEYQADPDADYTGMWVHDSEGWVPEELFEALGMLVKLFNLKPIFIEIAFTCSKPRLSAFGGQLVMITADEIRSRGTSNIRVEWEEEEVKRMTDNEHTTV